MRQFYWWRVVALILWLGVTLWPGAVRAGTGLPLPKTSKAAVEFEPGQVLVTFKLTAAQPDLPAILAKPAWRALVTKSKLEVAQAGLYHLYLAPDVNQAEFIKTLRTEPGVVRAEPNYIFHLFDLDAPKIPLPGKEAPYFAQPSFGGTTQYKAGPHRVTNDPYRANQYYLNITSMGAAWDLTTGDRLTVAVEDSGVRFDHPDLVGRLRGDGFNFVADSGDVNDDLGHGTEVAGVIAANSNNSIGIAGISWAANILPIKIANAQGSIDANAAAEGIYYAVEHGARILNLSYGGETSSGVLEEAVAYALSNQVTVVAAAGNAPDGATEYPAAYPGVIAVTATDAGDQLAFFDSYGPYVSLSAPGQDIYTTALNKEGSGDYSLHSGTSFSSPIVAGTVALMLTLNPYLRPAQIKNALVQTADKVYPPDPAYYYYYGSGRLNALQALRFAAGSPAVPFPPAHHTQVLFSQHFKPNQTVQPGDNLRLEVTATNLGPDRAASVWANLPLDPNLSLEYILTQPSATNEWVTGVFSDHFNIQLGPLQPSTTVTFTAVFRVKPTAPPGTNIGFGWTGFWDDEALGGSNRANPVAVTVADNSGDSPTNYRLASISPSSGKIGQAFRFASDSFAANEPVALWLNLPDGTVQSVTTTQADSNGTITLILSSHGQKQTGNYSLVAHGQASQLEIVARFLLTS